MLNLARLRGLWISARRDIPGGAGNLAAYLEGILTAFAELLGGELSFPNAAAASAFDWSTIDDGAICYVATFRDHFALDRSDHTTPVDGVEVLATTPPTVGRLHRQNVANPYWQAQTTWEVNARTGNDEADGSVLHPLRTMNEYLRRVGEERTLTPTDPSIVIFISGDLDPFVMKVNASGPADSPLVFITAVPPTPTTAVVTAVQAPDPATQKTEQVHIASWPGPRLFHNDTRGTWSFAYDTLGSVANCLYPDDDTSAFLYRPGAPTQVGDTLSLYDPAALPRIHDSVLIGRAAQSIPTTAPIRPTIVVEGVVLENCALHDDVLVSRSQRRGTTLVHGAVPAFSSCADVIDDFNQQVQIISASVAHVNCLVTGVNAAAGATLVGPFFFHSGALTDFFVFAIGDVILVETLAGSPAGIFLQGTSLQTQNARLWSTPQGSIGVVDGSDVHIQAASTADFNVSFLQIGAAGTPIPALVAGAPVPATAACGTPAQLFAAPFNGVAIDYTTGATIRIS